MVDCPSPWEGKKCRWSDAAFIQYNPGFDGDRGDIARTTGNGSRTIDDDNPRFRIVRERSSGVVGHVLMFIGRTTGMVTPILDRLCVNMVYTDYVIRCQDIASGIGAFGDSGAPVFRVTNTPNTGDVELYGVMWGGVEDDREVYYSPMDQIQWTSELNPLKTCAPDEGC